MRTEERIKQLCNISNTFKKYDIYEFMQFCSVGEHEIIKHTRKEEVRMNRQLACVFGIANGMTLKGVGEIVGDFDHATVLHAIRVVYDDFIYGKKMKGYLNIFHKNIEDYQLGCNIHLSSALSNLENQLNKQIQCTN